MRIFLKLKKDKWSLEKTQPHSFSGEHQLSRLTKLIKGQAEIEK